MLRQPARGSDNPLLQELIDGAPLVHVADLTQLDHPIGRANVAAGVRTLLGVALRKDDALLGTISIARREPRPFSDKEIALLQNFAAQAVIAMENARLLTETREALEQQTATAEVLQVINSSPGDLAPVFDAMLDKAMRLCEATHSHLFTIDGEQVQPVAVRGDPHFAAWLKQGPQPLVRGSSVDRLRKGEPFVHILDTREMPPYRANPWFRELIDRSGCRTAINVPLHKDGVLLGTMHLYRPEVRAFSDKQIALLQNFAAQAVIAMENARLLGELRERTRDLEESLEYQTATSDVLQVISRSTFDLEPVLQTVLNTAMRLCGNSQGSIFRLEAGVYRLAVDCVVNPDYHTIEAQHAISPDPDTLVGRTALAGRPVQILDALADPDYAPKDEARLGGYRTMLGVPLLREGAPIGVICTARTVVQPFTDKQIELVRTFADQAVIAIENTRLLTELRETLEQQTATAEVLGVINSSPGELTPVFDAILEKAHNLCGAAVGLLGIFDGDLARRGAARL